MFDRHWTGVHRYCVSRAALGPKLAVASADRDALRLHAWAELTYTEIAHATGVPVGTVRSRISRARTLLRVQLEEIRDRRRRSRAIRGCKRASGRSSA